MSSARLNVRYMLLLILVSLNIQLIVSSCPTVCDCLTLWIKCTDRQLGPGIPNQLSTPDYTTKFLDLNKNKITTLTSSTGEMGLNLSVLENLDLSHNLITSLNKTDFKGVPALRELRLDSNLFTTFNIEPINHLLGLQDLFLRNNAITDSIYSLGNLNNLATLNLAGNKIKVFELSYASSAPRSFELLDISGNLLSNIGFDKSIKTITNLRVAKNKLISLDLEKLLHLKITLLDVSANLIQNIFYRGSADLQSMDRASPLFEHLETIDLSANRFTMIPSNFIKAFKKLSTISLARNNIHTVPGDVFKDLPIDTLNLFNNEIKTVSPNAFEGMTYKKVSLYLSENKIQHLDEDIFGQFSYPNNSYMHVLHHFEYGDNPWDCRCSLEWLNRLNVKESLKYSFGMLFTSPQCKTPFTVEGIKLTKFLDNHCNETITTITSTANIFHSNLLCLIIICLSLTL